MQIDHITKRSRKQVLIAPFKAFVVAIGLFLALAVSHGIFNFNYHNPTSHQENNKTLIIHDYSHQQLANKHSDENYKGVIILFAGIYSLFSVIFFGGFASVTIFSLSQSFLTAMLLLFRKSYPIWLYNWHKNITLYYFNFIAYNWLLTEKFPKIDGSQNQVFISFPEKPDDNLSRFLPLIKWLLTLPQAIISSVSYLIICVLISVIWPYIFLTGKGMPKKIHQIINGYLDWNLSLISYKGILVTDKYPSFIFRIKK